MNVVMWWVESPHYKFVTDRFRLKEYIFVLSLNFDLHLMLLKGFVFPNKHNMRNLQIPKTIQCCHYHIQ